MKSLAEVLSYADPDFVPSHAEFNPWYLINTKCKEAGLVITKSSLWEDIGVHYPNETEVCLKLKGTIISHEPRVGFPCEETIAKLRLFKI